MKKFLLLPFIIFLSQFVNAQELLFDVKVNTPKIQNVDPKVFKDMETNIQEFLNNRRIFNNQYIGHFKISFSSTLACSSFTVSI